MAAVAETLLSTGALYATMASVHRPATMEELVTVWSSARRSGKRLTRIGARRSFGRHFFPPDSVEGVDTTALRGRVRLLEPTHDGLWVRVPGSHTFEQLCDEVHPTRVLTSQLLEDLGV